MIPDLSNHIDEINNIQLKNKIYNLTFSTIKYLPVLLVIACNIEHVNQLSSQYTLEQHEDEMAALLHILDHVVLTII